MKKLFRIFSLVFFAAVLAVTAAACGNMNTPPKKVRYEKPDAALLTSTHNSVSVENPDEGNEYYFSQRSLSDIDSVKYENGWASAHTFNNLRAETEYFIYTRVKASEEFLCSYASGASIATKKIPIEPSKPQANRPPALNLTAGDNYITINNYSLTCEYFLSQTNIPEYDIDYVGGHSFVQRETFSGLESKTEYFIYARVRATEDYRASLCVKASINTAEKVRLPQVKIIDFNYSQSPTSITVTKVTTENNDAALVFEYRITGEKVPSANWQDSDSFTNLAAAAEYTVYCRIKQTSDYEASEALSKKIYLSYFPSGRGTAADPFVIASSTQFLEISKGLSYHYRLSANITLLSYRAMAAKIDEPFKGTLDGNGRTITYSSIENSSAGGLFGYIENASLKNIKVIADIRVVSDVNRVYGGGIAGYVRNSEIINCEVNFKGFFLMSSNSDVFMGGIAGCVSDAQSKISGCKVTADSSFESKGKHVYIGGIIGAATGNIEIINCNANFEASADLTENNNNRYLGGIAGQAEKNITVSGCTVKALLRGRYNGFRGNVYANGLVGHVEYAGVLTESKNTAECIIDTGSPA